MQEILRRTQTILKSYPPVLQLSGEKHEERKLYGKHAQLYQESIDRYQPKAFAVSSGPRDGYTDAGPNMQLPPRARYEAPRTHVLAGGDVQSPGEPVEPGVLSAVARYSGFAAPEVPSTVAGRRAALANWIAHRDNPLTARVMVNRIWQYHFGRGLAANPNNLGKTGGKPENPALLDWLARYFIDQGWSIKAVHRVILLSEAYRRTAEPRRVEAEVLRDSILAVSGELSEEAGGPGVFPEINEDVARQPRHTMGSVQPAYRPSPRRRQRNRRTIYTFQQRGMADPMIEVFNGPGPDLSCERRESTIVPTQAFTLFNSRFAHDAALAFALRLEREAASPAGRVERAFLLAFGRKPKPGEARAALAHLERMTRHHASNPPPPRPEKRPVVHTIASELTGETFRFVQQEDPEPYEENIHPSEVTPATRALADLALVLFNANEFVYVY
jgi:hypothetical protein